MGLTEGLLYLNSQTWLVETRYFRNGNNTNFNSPEFEGIKNEAGSNNFTMSVKKWIAQTNGISLK